MLKQGKANFVFPGRGFWRPVKSLSNEFSNICELKFQKKGENGPTPKPNNKGQIAVLAVIRNGIKGQEQKSPSSFEAKRAFWLWLSTN